MPAKLNVQQPALFPAGDSLSARFAAYHEAHPDIYREFRQMAYRLHRAGIRHYGAKAIFEAMRYHRAVSGRDSDGFKLNNVYVSRYARLLADEDPRRFADFFEFRVLRSA